MVMQNGFGPSSVPSCHMASGRPWGLGFSALCPLTRCARNRAWGRRPGPTWSTEQEGLANREEEPLWVDKCHQRHIQGQDASGHTPPRCVEPGVPQAGRETSRALSPLSGG